MIFSLSVWLWCLLSFAPQQALPTPSVKPPTGLIVGQVIDAATNRPVPGAIVTIGAPASRRVLVDDAGRFLFRDLTKASYSLTAAAPGYLDGAFGQKQIGGPAQPFALAEDQKVGDIVIKLWKEASIAGVVTDDIGSPVTGIYVSLVRREGAPAGKAAVFSAAGIVRTDNRGAYQFSSLAPGDYLVAVTNKITALPVDTPGDQATTQGLTESGSLSLSQMGRSPSPVVRVGDFLLMGSGGGGVSSGTNLLSSQLPLLAAAGTSGVDKIVAYPTTYYPGALTPLQATAITFAAGADRSDINLRLTPAAMTRVSGTLMGPEGPLTRFAVHLIPAYAANSYLERADEVGVTATDAKAAFTFIAVPPGQYVVRAWRLPMPGLTDREIVPDTSLWGQTTVTVGSDPVSGVALTLRPGGTIGGKVIFEGTGPPPNIATYPGLIGRLFAPVWPSAVQEGIGVRARVTANGEFLSAGLPPGLYSATPDTLPAGVGRFLESVTLEGKDLFITPARIDGQSVTGVVVTFTDRATQLSGRIQDSTGKVDPAASVVIFPADYRTWIQNGLLPQAARVVAASQAGTYAVPDMRPGEYLVAAIGEAALANWQQAATIEALAPLATRVTLVRGDNKQVDLKTVRR